MDNPLLTPIEQWMVRSNLQRIAEGENPTTKQMAILQGNGYPRIAVGVAKARLEYLRGELRAERISLDEILELQSLAPHIEPGDVELSNT